MCRFARIVVAIACFAIPTGAQAQATIAGTVRDTSGAVLPGVTVETSSPALIEKTRVTVTDETGQYRIETLPPGTYSVSYTLPGFNTAKREGVELTGSFTATLNAELRVGALEETVTVTGETPIVDVQGTTRQQALSHEIIDAVPIGRGGVGALNNLGLLIPGVTQGAAGFQDVGGTTATANPVSFRSHGGDANDQLMTQNGVSMGDALTTGFFTRLAVNMAATRETTIDTAAVNAELPTGGVRINVVPKDGGNSFEGTFYASFANESMQGTNLTQDLKDRGLTGTNSLKKVYDINPGFGGPLRQDRAWFYLSGMYNGNSGFVPGMFADRNANNPNAWTFDPDPGRPAVNDQTWKDIQGRFAWQATPRNKLGFTWHDQVNCDCSAEITATSSVEASPLRKYPVQRSLQADWISPITNRLLLEVAGNVYKGTSQIVPQEGLHPGLVSVTEQSTGLQYRSGDFRYRSSPNEARHIRGALSYVSQGHAVKVGFNHTNGWARTRLYGLNPVSYRFNNGVPNQITLSAYPYEFGTNIAHSLGIFAQDRWTIRRLTASYGVRYDWFKSSYPEQHLGPTVFTPTRDITYPEQDGASLHDLTPKLGAAYDLFGNGKTALKASLNKYVQGLATSLIAAAINPTNLVVSQTTRPWTDANRDFVPDCNLLLAATNGECGALAASDFGTTRPGATFDPDVISGWGKRFYNWELSAGVQHEIAPRVSVDLGFFRRWFGNFLVTDNSLVSASDFTQFNITAPTDARLPGGGGYQVTGLYDLNPNKVGQVSNLIAFSDNYGKMTRNWNGVDLNVTARPRNGLRLQGGFSTGREVTDYCDVLPNLPEASFGVTAPAATIGTLSTVGFAGGAGTVTPAQFCRQSSGWVTQLKMLGSYTIPVVDVLASATVQSVEGPLINAQYVATNAVVAPSLGRNLSGGANATVNIISPAGTYGERSNRLDVRIGKVVRVSTARVVLNVDLFNALNANPVIRLSNSFGTWQRPQAILGARLLKLGVQFDF